MVTLSQVRANNAALVNNDSTVAVFVGVSGIGGFALLALASTFCEHGKKLRVYVIGRSTEKINGMIAECQKRCLEGRFVFVQAGDLALLRDVDRVCEELVKVEGTEAERIRGKLKIDLLVMT